MLQSVIKVGSTVDQIVFCKRSPPLIQLRARRRMMIYRLPILMVMLILMAACAPLTMNGKLVSGDGDNLGPAQVTASDVRGLRKYTVKALLPDETVFSGEMKYGAKSVTLFDDNGLSMNCVFDLNDPEKSFQGGGTGSCAISDGQHLKVKF